MDALHSVSESGGPYAISFKPSRSLRQASIFQENDYIRALNQLLQLELGTIALYRRCFDRWIDANELRFAESHQHAAKNLVNLIVANRGIPDKDRLALPAEISIFVTRLSLHLGSKIGHETARRVCLRMEKMLRRRYHAVLDLAPARDHSCLIHLIYNTKKNIERLEAHGH